MWKVAYYNGLQNETFFEGAKREVRMEPTKEDDWQWFDLDRLPEKLYSPTRKFIEAYLKLRQ